MCNEKSHQVCAHSLWTLFLLQSRTLTSSPVVLLSVPTTHLRQFVASSAIPPRGQRSSNRIQSRKVMQLTNRMTNFYLSQRNMSLKNKYINTRTLGNCKMTSSEGQDPGFIQFFYIHPLPSTTGVVFYPDIFPFSFIPNNLLHVIFLITEQRYMAKRLNGNQRWSNRTRVLVLVLEYEYILSTRTRVRRKVIVLVLEYITKVIVLTITSHDYIFFI